MRDNERAAQSFGLNLVRVRLATFAISGFLAALAGVLFAHHQREIDAQAFGPEQSITMFLMAVIGGLGSVSGVLLGAAYIGAVRIFGNEAVQLLAGGAGVLVVLMFFPGGIGSLAYRLRDAWLRRVAIRYRVFVPSLLGDRRLVESARAPLVPKLTPTGDEVAVPVRYRMRSRIRTAGASQRTRTWSG
jgi:branched-chain amino acid transport system permease protein